MVQRTKGIKKIIWRRAVRPQEQDFISQKILADRKMCRQGKSWWVVLIMLCAAIMSSTMFNYTYAFFAEQEQFLGDAFQSDHIDNYLILTHGKARATFPAVGDPSGETRPATSCKGGLLIIDFGEVVQFCARNFNDVLRLSNITRQPLLVLWRFEGEIASVLDRSEGVFTVGPENKRATSRKIQQEALTEEVYGGKAYTEIVDTTVEAVYEETYSNLPEMDDNKLMSSTLADKGSPYSLDFKLDAEGDPGLYEGYLLITVNGDFLSLKIPTRVVIRPDNRKKEVVASQVYSETLQSETPLNEPKSGNSGPEQQIEAGTSDGAAKVESGVMVENPGPDAEAPFRKEQQPEEAITREEQPAESTEPIVAEE